ncbi:hypothetical protein H7Y63_02440 [Polaromonas sp.]|nr:hypothetical protein [Candidatus Saccharibacteria bacterium]
MDSLFSILGQKNFDEPPEAVSIKKFVWDEYKTAVTVLVRDKDISVQVPGAALANTLRLRAPELKRRCQIDKKINFRIT